MTVKFNVFLCKSYFVMLLLLAFCCKKNDSDLIIPIDTVTDIDGNIYHFDTIGTQIWMLENLKVTHYRNGDSIPKVQDTIDWTKLKTDAYCNARNSDSLVNIYGRLYNWYAVSDPRNIAPEGWHVASYKEWLALINYFGGVIQGGGKLRETGTEHWIDDPNATNESSFTALPGGYRSQYNGWFNSIGVYGYWWTSSELDSIRATYCGLFYCSKDLLRNQEFKHAGYSIRCVKD